MRIRRRRLDERHGGGWGCNHGPTDVRRGKLYRNTGRRRRGGITVLQCRPLGDGPKAGHQLGSALPLRSDLVGLGAGFRQDGSGSALGPGYRPIRRLLDLDHDLSEPCFGIAFRQRSGNQVRQLTPFGRLEHGIHRFPGLGKIGRHHLGARLIGGRNQFRRALDTWRDTAQKFMRSLRAVHPFVADMATPFPRRVSPGGSWRHRRKRRESRRGLRRSGRNRSRSPTTLRRTRF